jgi:hypothetical protein
MSCEEHPDRIIFGGVQKDALQSASYVRLRGVNVNKEFGLGARKCVLEQGPKGTSVVTGAGQISDGWIRVAVDTDKGESVCHKRSAYSLVSPPPGLASASSSWLQIQER